MKITQLRNPRRPRRNFDKLEQRRRTGMKLLSTGMSQAEVARHCRVSETTVFRWKEAKAKKGASAWKRGRLGRPPGRSRPSETRSESRSGSPVRRGGFRMRVRHA